METEDREETEEVADVLCVWADGLLSLKTGPTPYYLGTEDWRAMLKGAAWFFDVWGSRAAASGWTAGELFGLGLHDDERLGAAWLPGRLMARIIDVTAEEMTYTFMSTSERYGYDRGRVCGLPAWEVTDLLREYQSMDGGKTLNLEEVGWPECVDLTDTWMALARGGSWSADSEFMDRWRALPWGPAAPGIAFAEDT